MGARWSGFHLCSLNGLGCSLTGKSYYDDNERTEQNAGLAQLKQLFDNDKCCYSSSAKVLIEFQCFYIIHTCLPSTLASGKEKGDPIVTNCPESAGTVPYLSDLSRTAPELYTAYCLSRILQRDLKIAFSNLPLWCSVGPIAAVIG